MAYRALDMQCTCFHEVYILDSYAEADQKAVEHPSHKGPVHWSVSWEVAWVEVGLDCVESISSTHVLFGTYEIWLGHETVQGTMLAGLMMQQTTLKGKVWLWSVAKHLRCLRSIARSGRMPRIQLGSLGLKFSWVSP